MFFDPSCLQPYRHANAARVGPGRLGSHAGADRRQPGCARCAAQPHGSFRTLPSRGAATRDRTGGGQPRFARTAGGAQALSGRADIPVAARPARAPVTARALAGLDGRPVAETSTHIVCVSEYQRRDVEATLHSIGLRDQLRVSTIYNPVEDSLVPDDSAVDPDTLVFFSSPNKGLSSRSMHFVPCVLACPRCACWSPTPATTPDPH